MTLPEFVNLFPEFRAPSWAAWRTILARVGPQVREFWCVAGRGSGKSRIAALLACFFASRVYARAPGESIYVGVFAPDRKQAAITLRYIVGLLKSVPALARLIATETRDSIELSNGVVIEVITATTEAPRGRGYALAIIEEAAFLPTDYSANPDRELLRAIRPALARVSGSLLAVLSSPWGPQGEMYKAWQRYHHKPDSDVVFVQAPTLDLNPTFDRRAIAQAYEQDLVAAASEYGAEFRDALGAYIRREVLDHATRADPAVAIEPGLGYVVAIDAAGGSGEDAFAVAVAHAEVRGESPHVVVDFCAERRPPFSPAEVVVEVAAIAEDIGTREVYGDRSAFAWVESEFQGHGLTYRPVGSTTSENFLGLLAMLNSGRVSLPPEERLVAQLATLQRRVSPSGHESIEHARGGHDDLAAAVAGAVAVVAARPRRQPLVFW